MYFSNATVYQITRDLGFGAAGSIDKLFEQLNEFAFTECGSQDWRRIGWVAPLQAFGGTDMVLAGTGRILFSLKREEKILPAASVKKLLNEKVKAMEAAEDRHLGKREKDALKDDIIQQLLPRCLTKESILNGYISIPGNILVIDTPTCSQAEEFCALLRKTMGSLPIIPLQSNTPLEATMTTWLKTQTNPAGFDIGYKAFLQAASSEGGKARFTDQDLFSDEILQHIEVGKVVKEISLIRPQTMSFVLNDSLQLKGIKWAEELRARNDEVGMEDVAARMDADFALMTGELDKVLYQLFSVMNVELELDGSIMIIEESPAVSNATSDIDKTILLEEPDNLHLEAVIFVSQTRRPSVSAIQRKFKIGYNRAARIIERMEANGVVSACGHNGAREVLIPPMKDGAKSE